MNPIVIREIDGLIYSALTGDEKRALITGAACEICGATAEDGATIVLDHDHDTGMVRGILCQSCNSKLGHIERLTVDWTNKAAAYLKTPQANKIFEIAHRRYLDRNAEWIKELRALEAKQVTLHQSIREADARMAKIRGQFKHGIEIESWAMTADERAEYRAEYLLKHAPAAYAAGDETAAAAADPTRRTNRSGKTRTPTRLVQEGKATVRNESSR